MPYFSLRDYQADAVNASLRLLNSGETKSVCLVCPTGGGKTVMGSEIVQRALAAKVRVLALAHRRELVANIATAMPTDQVGFYCPGFLQNPGAAVQVSSVQTLLARGIRPPADLILVDECHHMPKGGDWTTVLEAYAHAYIIGLTATPERSDGAGLQDTFKRMVVAAQPPELLEQGWLVPCIIKRPERGVKDAIADDPVAAYQRYTPGKRAFCFVRFVPQAKDVAARFNAAGIRAAAIHDKTPEKERDQAVKDFRSGKIMILVNVFCLTEGVDVPEAEVCILCRRFTHVSPFLQATGRVLRPAPWAGKRFAYIIDLPGVTYTHGTPLDPREYSIDGGIKKSSLPGLRVCMRCGYTFPSAPLCPQCGFAPPPDTTEKFTVKRQELQDYVVNGHAVDFYNVRIAWQKFEDQCRRDGKSLGWARRAYEAKHKFLPPTSWMSKELLRGEYERLLGEERSKKFRKGYAFARFQKEWGCSPPSSDAADREALRRTEQEAGT